MVNEKAYPIPELYTLPEQIVRYRARHDMTQAAFAAQCGLTAPTIGAIEAGKRGITRLTRAKIIQVLEKEESV